MMKQTNDARHTKGQAGLISLPAHANSRKIPFLGSYDLTEEDDLCRFAMDTLTVVQAVLQQSAGEDEDLQPHELLAAGCLLEWARDFLDWYGVYGNRRCSRKSVRHGLMSDESSHPFPGGVPEEERVTPDKGAPLIVVGHVGPIALTEEE